MFADDNITFAASTMTDLENGLNSEFRSLNLSNKLSLNVAKTEFMVIGSNRRLHSFSDDPINIEIDTKLTVTVRSPYLNNGVTLAHFPSSGNIPDMRDLLKYYMKD